MAQGKVKNCPFCGKLFAQLGNTEVCPNCLQELEELEHEIVEFVRDHPDSKIHDICEATGAKESIIKKMIKEGRFIQTGIEISYPCEKCGAPIVTGKYCGECLQKMREAVQEQNAAYVANKQREQAADRGTGMHSRDMRRMRNK